MSKKKKLISFSTFPITQVVFSLSHGPLLRAHTHTHTNGFTFFKNWTVIVLHGYFCCATEGQICVYISPLPLGPPPNNPTPRGHHRAWS